MSRRHCETKSDPESTNGSGADAELSFAPGITRSGNSKSSSSSIWLGIDFADLGFDMVFEFGQTPVGFGDHAVIRMGVDQLLRFTKPFGSRGGNAAVQCPVEKWFHRRFDDLLKLAGVERDHGVDFGLFKAGCRAKMHISRTAY
jgi:hypothetical protein